MSYNLQRYIPRQLEGELVQALDSFPVTAILGPRQCGKSTLTKHIVSAREDTLFHPELFFHTHRNKLICIDEVQVGPELFSILRAEIDAQSRPGRFLLLGSASQELNRKSPESLAST